MILIRSYNDKTEYSFTKTWQYASQNEYEHAQIILIFRQNQALRYNCTLTFLENEYNAVVFKRIFWNYPSF